MELRRKGKPLDHAGHGLKTLGREDGDALADAVVLTRLDEVVNWGRRNSLWPLPYATACCGIEFMGLVSSVYDVSRFGAELVRFSPRQSDLLIVAGTVNYKQAPILKRIYEQMSEPKWVIAMGVCASSGGFYDNYSTLQGIDKIIPVDYYVGGCPPRPEALLETILDLQKRMTRNKADLG
jgi:NADH-quinone oxidoreductase subunit B